MKSALQTFLFSLMICSLLACNNAGDKKSADADSARTNTEMVDSVALSYAGTYSGYLPCADCAGIMTYLMLNGDMSYRMEETYQGKNDSAFVQSGTWKREGDKVMTYGKDGKMMLSYLVENDQLIQLDIEGKRISGNLGDKYRLAKGKLADNPAWNEKRSGGIDFVGLGNEPFWSLEIDKGNFISFNTPEMKVPVKTTYTEPVVNNGVREYRLEGESTRLNIRVEPRFCSDGMSDFLYEYKVSVEHNGRKYSGCGAMLSSL
jgi:uncharacterized membrane protein